MNIDLDKIEEYARGAGGDGNLALLALVHDVRAGDMSAKLKLEHQLEILQITGYAFPLAFPLADHPVRQRSRAYADREGVSESFAARVREAYVTGAMESIAELGARTRDLEEANNHRQELVLQVEELTSHLDAARRTQLGQATTELDALRMRNAELESDLAKLSAHVNDVSGRLLAMTDVAAKSSSDASAALEREGRTNAALRDAYVRIEWLIGDRVAKGKPRV